MDTINKIRLNQLLQPFEGPGGIASLNPLAFQYQDQQYLNQDPTQDFYEEVNISPTQNFYPLDRNPTQMFYQPREFVNAPNAIDYYQPDLTTLRGLDMNRFQGVSDMSKIDETTNDAQDFEFLPSANESDLGYFYDANRNLYDSDDQKPKGIARLFEFLKNLPTPFNLARRGLESLRGANQRLRNTDFGQSKNLMEYLGKRQARKEAERLAPIQKQLQEASDRGGGYQATSRQQNEARTASRVGPRGNTKAYGL